MAERDSHPVRNSVIAGLIVVAIGSASTYLFGYAPTIWSWLVAAVSGVVKLLAARVAVPVWLLFLLVLAATPTLLRIGRSFRGEAGPSINDYAQDTFFGMVWRWRYHSDGSPIIPTPYCRFDDTALVPQFQTIPMQVVFFCETCRQTFGPMQGDYQTASGTVMRQIERKIRTGVWRETLKGQDKRASQEP